ncbi:MAG: HlyD family efflux transporter periplasmic adaptor subunit [Acidobacteria bacterium]|nr:HlyD family efflux transporter periplasmic adaptor subunit [Acidobacteriota bacterium]
MSTAFTRTLRALDADRFVRPGTAILLTAGFLGAWGAWAVLWQVTLRAVSDKARIEVDSATYPVQSPMVGRVVRTWLAVGREVRTGEPLVELDATPERLQFQEERTRADSLAPSLAALRQQVTAELQAQSREQQASLTAVEQARANARSAEAPARYADLEAARLDKLRSAGLIAEREYQRARADAEQSRASVDRETLVVSRLGEEQRTHESDRDARIRGLQVEIARTESQIATSRAAIARLENEIERRMIRAPVNGRLGEAQTLRVGGVLEEGERLAAIVPDGRLLVVAQFAPAAALGRLAEGQTAEVRLQGFPWAQWGTVPVLVARVASEIRDGAVRVELKVDTSRPCRIPLQHGMPGSVEVAVERISPATLMLRLAGQLLASPRNPYSGGRS